MDREVELNEWREAGKEVGRKLGVVQERERIIKLLLNTREGLDAILAAEFDSGEQLEKLIKGENK